MNEGLASAVERALGASIRGAEAVSGGDINDAYRVTLANGDTVFVKANDRADSAMFPAEARGLTWLGEASALRVPRVLAVSDAGAPHPFLALEYLAAAPRVRGFDERLGRGLSRLHCHGAPGFGLHFDNFIGRLPQSNATHPSWAEFYRDERLLPQLELARRSRRATARMERGFEALFARLDDLVGSDEPPARLHGDVWGGNLHVDERGEPCLVDPAPYGGHRESGPRHDAPLRRFLGAHLRCVRRSSSAVARSRRARPLVPALLLDGPREPLRGFVRRVRGECARAVLEIEKIRCETDPIDLVPKGYLGFVQAFADAGAGSPLDEFFHLVGSG